MTSRSIKRAHRITATFVGVFITLHLVNHFFALVGVEQHIAVMKSLRKFYRNPIVEPILIVLILAHIGSGVKLFFQKQEKTLWTLIQKWSGFYLAIFLLIHLSGVILFGRGQLDIDTNFYFAAMGLLVFPFKLFFIPYYTLAIIAVFCHLGAFLRIFLLKRVSERVSNVAAYAFLTAGIICSLLIVSAFGGLFYEIHPPEIYEKMFQ